ncbi:MAG: hypothetical protein QM784_09960 [Polyangiaceae bacterium]
MSTYQSSDEYREFWASVDEAAEKVAKWPEWKIDRVQAAQFAKAEAGDRDSSKSQK